MSYQVLARKYRPANFEEMEGQEHVLRALINSLEQNRLHHAYLFTGTRGVGKTTIARILAKCFNCERGVTAKPCGECSVCLEIAQGRSVDLIEVDAASRTRVEDTRELLENVQYMPTHSRFKVYLIDEVHMLSNHSFNALLKTLEEPPEHVKFLLATTDPKKLPVTVLSRCLQFNLKNLSPERVVNYLKRILAEEHVNYEEPALWQLGRAADGSMRDALSLTDQAISFGENELKEADVRAMLGSIDHREVYELLDALIERDAARLLARIAALAEFGPDYEMLLAELLRVLHRVAIAQAIPDGVDNSHGDRELILAVARSLGREEVQLCYQIGLIGKRDLPLAPDPRDGFEMVMLRMLAFAPDQFVTTGADSTTAATSSPGGDESAQTGTRASPVAGILAKINAGDTDPKAEAVVKPATGPVAAGPQAAANDGTDEIPWGDTEGVSETGSVVDPRTDVQVAPAEVASPDPAPEPVPVEDAALSAPSTPDPDAGGGVAGSLQPENWETTLEALGLAGVTRTLAANCVIGSVADAGCVLVLNEHHASLWNKTHEARIGKALTKLLGRDIKLRIEVGVTDGETPAQAQERRAREQREQAIDAIENDANVQRLIETFDGKLNVDSIVPRSRAGE